MVLPFGSGMCQRDSDVRDDPSHSLPYHSQLTHSHLFSSMSILLSLLAPNSSGLITESMKMFSKNIFSKKICHKCVVL